MSQYDFWTVNGSADFGYMPVGVLGTVATLPIRLQRGTVKFGEIHIRRKHWHWGSKHAASVPELVWKKCRQSAHIYSAEDTDKCKLAMAVHPGALMILRLIEGRNEPFFAVNTIYQYPDSLDGTYVTRYVDTLVGAPSELVFSLPALPQPPTIIFKKTRSHTKPA